MIPLSQAQAYVLNSVKALPTKAVSIDQALGMVLAEPVSAVEAIPQFDNTAMDGFAVRAADTSEAPVTLEVVGTIAAGDPGDIKIGSGQAARIMTGAPLPPQADAVVMVEHTRPAESAKRAATHRGKKAKGQDTEHVLVQVSVSPGTHVRRPGEDVTAGEQIFSAGEVVTPGHIGVLASIGVYEVVAYARPRVGVLSTGDELIDKPGPLRRGQIRDSNRLALLALVNEAGFEGVDLGIARDSEKDIERLIRAGASTCDALLSSGGVSMGDYDYVKTVLNRIGNMRWMQIAIKPAKPFAFGMVDSTPVFGLPGNPVSSMVSFELLAKPAIRAMAGFDTNNLGPFTVPATSSGVLRKGRDGKIHYMRVSVVRDGRGALRVFPLAGQGSHQLTVMARADGLAVVLDRVYVGPGDKVEVILL